MSMQHLNKSTIGFSWKSELLFCASSANFVITLFATLYVTPISRISLNDCKKIKSHITTQTMS